MLFLEVFQLYLVTKAGVRMRSSNRLTKNTEKYTEIKSGNQLVLLASTALYSSRRRGCVQSFAGERATATESVTKVSVSCQVA